MDDPDRLMFFLRLHRDWGGAARFQMAIIVATTITLTVGCGALAGGAAGLLAPPWAGHGWFWLCTGIGFGAGLAHLGKRAWVWGAHDVFVHLCWPAQWADLAARRALITLLRATPGLALKDTSWIRVAWEWGTNGLALRTVQIVDFDGNDLKSEEWEAHDTPALLAWNDPRLRRARPFQHLLNGHTACAITHIDARTAHAAMAWRRKLHAGTDGGEA